jgi:hypothetical protein
MRISFFIRLSVSALVVMVVSSNATAFSSGQTDRLKKGTFFKSYSKKSVSKIDTVAVVPVGFDASFTTEFFYEGREGGLQPLAAAINAYLDSVGEYHILPDSIVSEKGAPSVHVGSSEGESAPPAAEMMREEHDKYPPMVIHIQRPSKEWRAKLAELLDNSNAQYMLVINLGFSEYPKSDKGMFGKKVVLGTGYERDIRFLSAEDKPVEVLQLTGILLDSGGNILRAGAEGLFHEDTPFWAQVMELKKAIDDRTLQRLVSEERREELPGQPLVWQAGLQNLLANLLGR